MAEPPHRDLYPLCRACKNRFLYTAHEQRQRQTAGAEGLPELCPACRALDDLCQRRIGRVDWYNRQRGYGFIRQEDASSLFVHASALQAPAPIRLAEGMRVRYLVEHTDRGPRAVDVEILDLEQ